MVRAGPTGPPEAALSTDPRALVDEELALAARVQAALRQVGAESAALHPYFAHLRVMLNGRARELLVGEHSQLELGDALPAILGWRQAPLARVLFGCSEGESFDEEINERSVEGQVLVRRLIGWADGAPSWIASPELELQRDAAGAWQPVSAPRVPPLAPCARPGRAFADRDALDDEQRAVLAVAHTRSVLVVGAAGSGKTTVALHRLRALVDAEPAWQARTLVLVPEPGLAALVQARLKVLGLPRVPVRTYDAWVARQHRLLWPARKTPLLDDAPVSVLRLKRHPALRQVLVELVQAQWRELLAQAGRALDDAELAGLPWPTRGDALQALEQAERSCARRHPDRRDEIHDQLHALRERWLDVHADLPLLLGDRERLERVRALSGDEIRRADVDDTLARARRQLDPAADQAWAHVEVARRTAMDGRGLDADTPDAVAGSLDLEDVPLLLELLWLKTGACKTRDGDLAHLAHIVVDEVQDVAAVELASLVRALVPGGALTAAGDDAQHLDASAARPDWQRVLDILGADRSACIALRHSHRCPQPVHAFTSRLRVEPALSGPAPEPGPAVVVTTDLSPGLAALVLRDALDALLALDSASECAIVCRDAAHARTLHAALQDALPARLVLDGSFPFRPGLVVTEVQAVRGLEFDHVVLPDVTAERYPATAEARAALHLAASRARWQLWILCPGEASPLLDVAAAMVSAP